ncbi:uncharacterized protein LOC129921238 [Episyrphus balteatus]|uniref:uncharacterized protein LOC129921238 n=1 Tax=Episyrphus balteatus TaxID=286459 RepID=UPI0024868455|nr:uncharacterized protein LOC129921238 [Episyrphus balteatus]
MAEQHQSIENFIEIVKSNNILWDLTNPDYKNIKKKAVVWRKISQEFGLPPETCKRKWKSLRDCCCRDLNKKTDPNQSGEESEAAWKYREHMEFVRDFIKPKMSIFQTTDSKKPSPTRIWNGKPKTTTLETTFLSTMKTVQESLKRPHQDKPSKSTSDDEDDLFCQSLIKKIKKFPLSLKNDAKLEMLRFLNSVENKLHSETDDVNSFL